MPNDNSSADPETMLDVMAVLEMTIKPILKIDTNDLMQASDNVRSTELLRLMAKNQAPNPKMMCKDGEADIANACRVYERSAINADMSLKRAQTDANETLVEAISAWNMAKDTYSKTYDAAKADRDHAQAVALNNYKQALQQASQNHDESIIAALELVSANTLQTYETTMSIAANALTSAACTLIEAYATYIGAVQANQTTHMVSNTAAKQIFWQDVTTIKNAS